MLPEEIQRLVNTTLRKLRRIIQIFEEALHALVGYSIKVSKPNVESRSTEWEYDCAVAPDVFWKSGKEAMQDIVTYTQQLGMAQEFHSEDIKLVLEAVTKYFLLYSEYLFQENDLELKAYMSKALRKPMLSIKNESDWVLQNWNNIMAFMMCGTHLDREVHTAGDSLDPVPQGIGSYPQTPGNKGKGSS